MTGRIYEKAYDILVSAISRSVYCVEKEQNYERAEIILAMAVDEARSLISGNLYEDGGR